jgi:hypothetical protein
MPEPIVNFKETKKTTEYLRTIVVLMSFALSQFLIGKEDVIQWAVGVCVLASGYCISRGLVKKSRLGLLGKGEQTTEFAVSLLAYALLLIRYALGGISLATTLLLIAIIEGSYAISRGHGKSFIPSARVIQNGR